MHLVLVMPIVMTYNYTMVLCHYGLLMIETRDAWADRRRWGWGASGAMLEVAGAESLWRGCLTCV